MSNDEFNEELSFIKLLKNDDTLFEREFENIKNAYPFKDYEEIHDFFSENRGLIVILKKIKPLLEKYVSYASFHLELDIDPLFSPQLLLVIKALDTDFKNGFKDDIKLIDSKIDSLVIKLNLGREFFIYDTSCNLKAMSALTLKDMSNFDN